MTALEYQNRRTVWLEIDSIKVTAAKLEEGLQKEPDGVIPWDQLHQMAESVTRLIYTAGAVNALRLARGV